MRVLKPLSPGSVVELMFLTHAGPVLGMAELLSPCAAAPLGLQPFRFIVMDDSDLRTLRIAIASTRGVMTQTARQNGRTAGTGSASD